MNNKESRHGLFITVAFLFFCFVLVPIVFVYQGLEFFAARSEEHIQQITSAQISSAVKSLRTNTDPENYYLKLLNEKLEEVDDGQAFIDYVRSTLLKHNVAHDLLHWHKDQPVELSFHAQQSQLQKKAWQDFSRNLYEFYADTELNEKGASYGRLIPVLGPHFFLQTYHNRKPAIPFNLFKKLENKKDSPLVWFGEKNGSLFVIRLYQDSFCHETIVKSYFEETVELPDQYAFVDRNRVEFGHYSDAIAVKNALNHFDRFAELDSFVDDGCLYYKVQLAADNMIILIVQLESQRSHLAFVVKLMFLLLSSLFAWFVKEELLVSGLRNMSIIRQTLVFTMISAGIPTLVLFFSGASYFTQRQDLLMQQKSQEMVNYLQTIDRQSVTYLAYASKILESSISLFASDLADPAVLPAKIRLHFDKVLSRKFYNEMLFLFLDPALVVSGNIALDFSRGDKKPEGDADSKERKEARMWWALLKEYLYMLNGKMGESGMPEDVALFFEASFQKSYQLVIGFFLDADGKLIRTGFGSSQMYLYVKAEDQTDYEGFDSIGMGSLSEIGIARGYLERSIDGMQRNPYGLRIYGIIGSWVFPSESLDSETRENFAALSSNSAHSQPQTVTYDGQQWLFCGLNSKSLVYTNLVALYPLNEILDLVKKEQRELILMGVVALSLVLMLVLIFNFNLVFPIRQLSLAAEALEHRNFKFRVATLPDDELGEMGRIFNRSIEDFEELHIASAVQAKLFPQKLLSFDNISLFARTVPMVELGGDYNDYFVIDDQHVAMLLGDVAGHGVGASLIMAMAKAGIMCAKDVHEDPAQVLLLLHKLVVASKSKRQRKIMTFQYACFNRATGEGIYANAGGCHPLIINPQSRTVRELASIGSPLGAFKKAKYTNLNFKLEPGEAIVFYTDGIIESRNIAGDEIGYDRFRQWLIDHYRSDAEQYYSRVYEAYSDWIQNLEAQDDVSLVILVRSV